MATRVIGRQQRAAPKKRRPRAILIALMAGVLPGFVLFSAYLASLMGEGPKLLIAAPLLLLIAPFIAIFKLMGSQEHRVAKSVALWGAFSWLFFVLLLVGALERSSEVLKSHGAWFTSFWGTKERQRGDAIVQQLVNKLPLNGGVPYRFEGGSIIVTGSAKGPSGRVKARFILDTGASVSTISSKLAAALGLHTAAGGPTMEVQTAGGNAVYPLVTLDSLTLPSGHTVGPITAAVCDPCSGKGNQGLIGLKFTSHFHITINSKEALVKLRPRSGWVDQRNDVEPFVAVQNLTGDLNKDRFKVTGSLTNTSRKTIKGLVFECIVKGDGDRVLQRRRLRIKSLPPGTQRAVKLNMAPHEGVTSFYLEIKRGFWSQKEKELPKTLKASL